LAGFGVGHAAGYPYGLPDAGADTVKRLIPITDYLNSHEFVDWLETGGLLGGYIESIKQPNINHHSFYWWMMSRRVIKTFKVVAMVEDEKPVGFMAMELYPDPWIATIGVSHLYAQVPINRFAKLLVAEVKAFREEMRARYVTFVALNPKHIDNFSRLLGLKTVTEAAMIVGDANNG